MTLPYGKNRNCPININLCMMEKKKLDIIPLCIYNNCKENYDPGGRLWKDMIPF